MTPDMMFGENGKFDIHLPKMTAPKHVVARAQIAADQIMNGLFEFDAIAAIANWLLDPISTIRTIRNVRMNSSIMRRG